MDKITDWLLVVINLIYVVATIFICISNWKSAKASRDQIAESQRQFAESKRLEIMPYLQFEVEELEKLPEYDNRAPCLFLNLYSNKNFIQNFITQVKIKNIGSGIAHHMRLTIKTRYNENDGYPANDIVITPQGEKNTFVEFTVEEPDSFSGRQEDISVKILYFDVLGNVYSQEARLLLDIHISTRYSNLIILDISSPKLEQRNGEDKNV